MKYWKPIVISIIIQFVLIFISVILLKDINEPLGILYLTDYFIYVIVGSIAIYFLIWIVGVFFFSEKVKKFLFVGFISYILGWVLIPSGFYAFSAIPDYFNKKQGEQREDEYRKNITEKFLDKMSIDNRNYDKSTGSFKVIMKDGRTYSLLFSDEYLMIIEPNDIKMDSIMLLNKLSYYADVFCNDSVNSVIDVAIIENKIYLNKEHNSFSMSLPSDNPLVGGGKQITEELIIEINEKYLKEKIRGQ